MLFASFDSGEDGEHNGIVLVEISGIIAIQGDIFFIKHPQLTKYIREVHTSCHPFTHNYSPSALTQTHLHIHYYGQEFTLLIPHSIPC